MKDREISRLVLLNIGLLLAIILCVVFFFWLHGSIGAAPGVGGEINTGTGEMASSSLERFAPTSRSQETISPVPISALPAPESFKHFPYVNGMSVPVSGLCSAPYIAVLIFPAQEDYRTNSRAFVFDSAYPCDAGKVFSKTITPDMIHLSSGVSYYVIIADEKDSGTWYNPR